MSVELRSRLLIVVSVIGLILLTFVMMNTKSIKLPYEVENKKGKIVLTSMERYTGENPDNGNKKGENIAALTVENPKSVDLIDAKIKITMKDRSIYTFEVYDLPAGESRTAYELNNIEYFDKDKKGNPIGIRSVSVKLEFEE